MLDLPALAGTLAAVALAAFLLTGLVRRQALHHGMLDVPNERSSHQQPTPRGGGLAIVLTVLACALWMSVTGIAGVRELLAWCLGGGLVAAAGLQDDRRGLSARSRLLVHFAAAGVLVWASGGLAPLPWLGAQVDLGWPGIALATLAVVWSINLFNFMDGIDGLAASQAVFVAAAGAAIATWDPDSATSGLMAMMIAASCAGFLAWNWPPARIFMGDVGSGFLGFMLAACLLLSAREGSLSPWTWVTLHGVFLADATVTLIVRLARGERVHQAHRTHAYQHLARRWRSHRSVDLLLWSINAGWLLPIAVLGVYWPDRAPLLCAVALLPLIGGVIACDAGRPGRDVPADGR